MTTPRPGSRAEQRRRTEARILDAATQVFFSAGYDRTTIRAVASAAGVDAGLVMHYFGSKQELYRRVIDAAPVPEISGTPAEAAEQILAALADRLASAPVASLALLRSMLTNPEAASAASAGIARYEAQIAQAIPADDADLRAAIISAITLGITVSRHLIKSDELATAVAGGRAVGPGDRLGVGRVAGRQRAGRQRRGCLGHGGRAGRPGRGRGAEHGRRDQRPGGQVAKSHRGVLPARSAFRSGSYGRRWLASVGLASRLPTCPAGMRPVARAVPRGAAGHRRPGPPLLGYGARRYAVRGTRFPGRRAYAGGMDVKAVSRFAATFVTDTTNPPTPRPRWLRRGRYDLVEVADVIIALICFAITNSTLTNENASHHGHHSPACWCCSRSSTARRSRCAHGSRSARGRFPRRPSSGPAW